MATSQPGDPIDDATEKMCQQVAPICAAEMLEPVTDEAVQAYKDQQAASKAEDAKPTRRLKKKKKKKTKKKKTRKSKRKAKQLNKDKPGARTMRPDAAHQEL